MYPEGTLGIQFPARPADNFSMTGCNSPARVIGYVRVSTNEQAESGLSLDAQRERLAAYCTGLGAELVGIEADNGTSGKIAPDPRACLSRAPFLSRRAQSYGPTAPASNDTCFSPTARPTSATATRAVGSFR